MSRGRGGDRVHPSGSGPVPTSGGCSISHRRGAAYAFARPAAAPWVPLRGRPRGLLCGVGSVYPRPVTVNIWEGVSHAMYQSPFASPLRCMHASMFTAFADASKSQWPTCMSPPRIGMTTFLSLQIYHTSENMRLYTGSATYRRDGYSTRERCGISHTSDGGITMPRQRVGFTAASSNTMSTLGPVSHLISAGRTQSWGE